MVFFQRWFILLVLVTPLQNQELFAEDSGNAPKVAGQQFRYTDRYQHDWFKFIPIEATDVFRGRPYFFDPPKGHAAVVFFLASWCIACQKLITDFLALEQKYRKLPVKFLFVFAQTTAKDAKNFATNYQLGSNTVLGDQSTLKNYHQPRLPTIYVRDRYGWLVMRRADTTEEGLADVDAFLALHTSY